MTRVALHHSFEALPKPYEQLFGNTGAGIFLSLPWFRGLAATALGEKTQLRIYALESTCGGMVHLAIPMVYDPSRRRLFSPRKLAAAANCYTSLFSPLVGDTKCVQNNLNRVIKAMAADAPRWDTISLHPMDPDSPLFTEMLSAFRSAGMAVQRYFCFGNWYLKVNGRTYQEYASTLPPRLRNTLRRKAQQLDSANRLRIDIITRAADVPAGIEAYETVYQASWKPPEAYPEFIPGLIRMCAQHGWLRLGVAYVDDRPAAAQLWIVANGVASIYKLAYDHRLAKLSIGSLLTARLMQQVIDVDGVQEVDFLSGDDAYKQDWMPHRRERWGIMAFNLRTLKGVLLAVAHLAGHFLKNIGR